MINIGLMAEFMIGMNGKFSLQLPHNYQDKQSMIKNSFCADFCMWQQDIWTFIRLSAFGGH